MDQFENIWMLMANNWSNEMKNHKKAFYCNSSIIKERTIIMESFVAGLDNRIDIEFQLFCPLSLWTWLLNTHLYRKWWLPSEIIVWLNQQYVRWIEQGWNYNALVLNGSLFKWIINQCSDESIIISFQWNLVYEVISLNELLHSRGEIVLHR